MPETERNKHRATLADLANTFERTAPHVQERAELAAAIRWALAELDRLEEEARRFYLPDGSYRLLDTAEEAKEARIAAKHILAPQPHDDPAPLVQRGQYDGAKCPVCGIPWEEHHPDCSRFDFRPVDLFAPDALARGHERLAALKAETERSRALREDLDFGNSNAPTAADLAELEDAQ